jgi:hypothetical protein
MTEQSKYVREPQQQWEAAMREIERISDDRERAIELLRFALGDGAVFLATADKQLEGGMPFESDDRWADFFEHAEAGVARRGVHGVANAAFEALSLEEKLQVLASLDGYMRGADG